MKRENTFLRMSRGKSTCLPETEKSRRDSILLTVGERSVTYGSERKGGISPVETHCNASLQRSTSPQPPPKEGESPLLRRGRRVRCYSVETRHAPSLQRHNVIADLIRNLLNTTHLTRRLRVKPAMTNIIQIN